MLLEKSGPLCHERQHATCARWKFICLGPHHTLQPVTGSNSAAGRTPPVPGGGLRTTEHIANACALFPHAHREPQTRPASSSNTANDGQTSSKGASNTNGVTGTSTINTTADRHALKAAQRAQTQRRRHRKRRRTSVRACSHEQAARRHQHLQPRCCTGTHAHGMLVVVAQTRVLLYSRLALTITCPPACNAFAL